MRWVAGEFEPEIEKRYLREHLERSLPFVRPSWILAIVLFMAFFGWDVLQGGDHLVATFTIRAAWSAYTAIAVVLFSFRDNFYRHASLALLVSACSCGIAVSIILAILPNGFVSGIGGLIVVLMYGATFWTLRFRDAVIFILSVFASSNLAAVFADTDESLKFVLINTNFFVVSAAMIGALFGFYFDFSNRSRFRETGSVQSFSFRRRAPGEFDEHDQARTSIFLCYRRADSAFIAGRIKDKLVAKFGDGSVTMDVSSIPVGMDYRTYLGSKIRESTAVLVVIGDRWDLPRLSKRSDPVRIEVELAFNLGKRTIPVLLDSKTMPTAEELPESMSKLSDLQAAKVRPDPDFDTDLERLAAQLDSDLATSSYRWRTHLSCAAPGC